MRATSNEDAAMSYLLQEYWVHIVYDVSMLFLRSNPSIAASPNGIALMTSEHFEDLEWDVTGCLEVNGKKLPLAVVEMKPAFASRSRGAEIHRRGHFVRHSGRRDVLNICT